jgi:hypothetical protein
MLSPNTIESAKEHYDVVALLLFLAVSGLLGVCIYIVRQHNQTESKTISEVEKHASEIIRLQEQCKQVDKTAAAVDQQGKYIARLFTGVGKMMTAYNSKHPGENLEV